MDPDQADSEPAPPALRCSSCGTPIAGDQHYCVECGQRALPLPHRVEAYVGQLGTEHAPPPPEIDAPQDGPDPELLHLGPLSLTVPRVPIPSPRTAATAVMGVLALGVALGSENLGLASPPGLIVLNGGGPAHTASPAIVTAATGSSGATGSTAAAATGTTGATATTGAATSSSTTAATTSSTSTTPTGGTGAIPEIGNVWVISLADQGYDKSFAPGTGDTYLSTDLAKLGEVVPTYYAVASGNLANDVAMISGQGPTPQTAANCATYSPLKPGRRGKAGQVLGTGCVYPKPTRSLLSELTADHKTWRAYVEGYAGGCQHPRLGAHDKFFHVVGHGDYATWRNPALYLAAVTGSKECAGDIVGIPKLATDLKTASATPAVSLIYPGPCDDGSDTPCRPGAAAGLAPANKFLKGIVPELMASAAYKAGGLILVTFDQAPQSGTAADFSSCCSTPSPYPNLPATTSAGSTGSASTPTSTTGTSTTPTSTATGTSTTAPGCTAVTTTTSGVTVTTSTSPYAIAPTTTCTSTTTTATTTTPLGTGGLTSTTGGGGEVGLLALSPFVTPNTSDVLDFFNHYSLLASIEDLFGLKLTGYAAQSELPVFGRAFYSAYQG